MSRPDKLPKVLSEDEQRRFLAEFNTRYVTPNRNLLLCRLMLEAGLRVGEVVALRPEHVDLETCRVMVREGKGAKDRVVWVTDDLRDEITGWLERRAEWLEEPEACRWLFPTRHGTQVLTRYVRAMVKRVAQKADVQEAERVSPHTLRHTAATDLYRETQDLRLVQKALGHASIQTTQIYTHLVDGELEAAMREQENHDGAG